MYVPNRLFRLRLCASSQACASSAHGSWRGIMYASSPAYRPSARPTAAFSAGLRAFQGTRLNVMPGDKREAKRTVAAYDERAHRSHTRCPSLQLRTLLDKSCVLAFDNRLHPLTLRGIATCRWLGSRFYLA